MTQRAVIVTMAIQTDIEHKIEQNLNPQLLTVENESHRHGGPAIESHFKLTVVSDQFTDLSRVKRHQRVYSLLSEELEGAVHALALHLYSPEEWRQNESGRPDSPDCRGGSKFD